MELLNPISIARAASLFIQRTLYRTDITLSPTADPRVFTTPDTFQHDEGEVSINVFHNGRRLNFSLTQRPSEGDYYVDESSPGGGYDEVHLLTFTPNSRSTLVASYYADS
jgi:hypothetical protein